MGAQLGRAGADGERRASGFTPPGGTAARSSLTVPTPDVRASSRSPSPGWERPSASAGPAPGSKPRIEGPLLKLSPSMFGGWQLRWFELNGGCFRYWKTQAEAKAGKPPQGEVNCKGLSVAGKSGTTFKIKTSQTEDREFQLDAEVKNKVDAEKWDIGPKPAPSMQDWIKAFEQEGVASRM